ncbi:TPA: hypothetical protein QCX08_004013 [Bacillus cytotoxicus]|nr:hypothetical protein [Bacillus cytotoxicus]HDR7866135.1 hypothetical protein [Bacillus cytotoxicus]
MSRVLGIISGIGMLIALYLFLNNARQTTQIIDSIAGNGVKGIKTLQGR